MQRAADLYSVSRASQARGMREGDRCQRDLAAFRKEPAEKILRRSWGRDEGALQLLNKAAVSPTSTADFAVLDAIGPFRSLAPASRVAREERMMLQTFGDSYRAYMARTGQISRR
jgi:hypothetical protein